MLRKNWEKQSCRLTVSVCFAALVGACSSGGGGSSLNSGGSPSGGSPSGPVAYPITVAQASFGSSPIAPVLAGADLVNSNTGTFDYSFPRLPLRSFPALQTAVQVTPNGVKAADPTSSAAVNVSLGPVASCTAPVPCMTVRLTVPSLAMDVTANVNNNLSTPTATTASVGGNTFSLASYGLSYVSFGVWGLASGNAQAPGNLGVYAIGYQTPSEAMPASGSATYTGTGEVAGFVLLPSGASAVGTGIAGDATVNANFATGKVNGTLSNMQAVVGTQTTPWNSVSLTADIAAGKNTFSGSTAATSAPAGTYSLKSTATGTVTGGFYGPAAENVGAVWTLSNPDGTGAAIGTLGAKH